MVTTPEMPIVTWDLIIVVVAASLYIGIRNFLVYRYRTRFLKSGDIESYDKLPDYLVMLFKFWVWPLDRFLRQSS